MLRGLGLPILGYVSLLESNTDQLQLSSIKQQQHFLFFKITVDLNVNRVK